MYKQHIQPCLYPIHMIISLQWIHARCIHHEIIFTISFQFSFLQKVKVKLKRTDPGLILLWLFGKHKNHFITVKNILSSIHRVISLRCIQTRCAHSVYITIQRYYSFTGYYSAVCICSVYNTYNLLTPTNPLFAGVSNVYDNILTSS